ncbi:MAG: hypothetical protein V3U75_03600 [Methylococcaceae bacterium]
MSATQKNVSNSQESVALLQIRAAQWLILKDRKQGLASLNEIFRKGKKPLQSSLDGHYDGELIALDIAPIVSKSVEVLARYWMPWKGKFLIKKDKKGDNIFGEKNRWLLKVLFPFYKNYSDYTSETFRTFVFQTSTGKGQVDQDRQVFKIDYAIPENPALSIRRILDEIVQVDEQLFLGKIHFKLWWGRWKMMGYFLLRHPS